MAEEQNIHMCGVELTEYQKSIKPKDSTHLSNMKPEVIEPHADSVVISAVAPPDPTDQILWSPNRTPGIPQGGWQGVTIHFEAGYHDGSVSWLRNPASNASAHWCIRRDGHIVQLVSESDRAWHAQGSGMYYFGIEHEGGGGTGWNGDIEKLWTTPADATTLRSDDHMLQASATLTAYLCIKYNLEPQHDFQRPYRRDTESVIAAHAQMSGNTHWDVGPLWPWKAYMARVKQLITEFKGGTPTTPVDPKYKPDWKRISRVEFTKLPVDKLEKFVITRTDGLELGAFVPKAEISSEPVVRANTHWGVQDGVVVSKFNEFRPDAPAQKQHKGEDVDAADFANVYAMRDGLVVRNRDSNSVSGYHQEITVEYDISDLNFDTNKIYVLKGHIKEHSADHKPIGSRVSKGEIVCKCGDNADAMDTNSHVHVQVWKSKTAMENYNNEEAVDPEPYRAAMGEPTGSKPNEPKVSVRSVYGITGVSRFTWAHVEDFIKTKKNATDEFLALAKSIYTLSQQAFGGGDFLVIQSGLETGWGAWSGGAKKYNPAGIKLRDATGDTESDFEVPKTPDEGARMLINHWCVALLNLPPIGQPHGRAALAREVYKSKGVFGKITSVDQLGNGIWAADPNYGTKLKSLLNELGAHRV